jgi:MFS family permease
MALTLHVVLGLQQDYGRAGLIGACATIGAALGAPVLGRLTDKLGLRRILAICAVGECSFWLGGWSLPMAVLPVAALCGGFFTIPMFSLGRQALAALVPPAQHQTAFALDSISVEVSYAVGPATGILIATSLSSNLAMIFVGVGQFVMAALIFAKNYALRAPGDASPGEIIRPPRKEWLGARFLAVMAVSFTTIFVLTGTELSAVAALREQGVINLTSVITIVTCIASGVGGMVYGAMKRSIPLVVLAGMLGLLTIPAGVLGQTWWLLTFAVIPANLFCAPTLSTMNAQVVEIVPSAARGEAMGLSAMATMMGGAVGAPLIGLVLDQYGASWGFAFAGSVGVLGAVVVVAANRTRKRNVAPELEKALRDA